MTLPRGLTTPKRTVFTLLIVAAALAGAIVVGLAWTHFVVKSPIPPNDLHASQAAQDMPVGDREAFGPEDFAEPKAK